MNILITFRHGFGDGVQLSIVLRHLQKYRPTWNVDVAALVGKHSAYQGLCRKVYILEREFPPCCEYSQRFNLNWHECHTAYADSPSTKAERCLREEFGIVPDPELCSYSIQRSGQALELARNYLERTCKVALRPDGRYPVVLIHYEGNTSAEMKNIPTEIIRRLCDDILEEQHVPVILDWDYRTPLADGVRIHCPDQRAELWHGTGTGDAESLAALTELSALMVGVDSGPLHVAAATSTPTLGVWTRHHPLHYISHADNVTHLIPRNHASLIRGDVATGDAYFNAHYHFQVYDDLEIGLRAAVCSRLRAHVPPRLSAAESPGMATPVEESFPDSLMFLRNFWIRNDTAEQDLVVVKDIAEEDSYAIDQMPMPRPVVVDVGAHIGCFSKRFHQRNPHSRIFAVECCPENIAALEKNVGEIATIIQGAVTYEPDVALLNAVYTNCLSTGGSTLIGRDELQGRVAEHQCATQPEHGMPGEYWADFRPIRTLTLEDLMAEHSVDHIDILKLDCEGSEFSILGKTPSLDRIGLIVGEYHGQEKFEQLVADRFAGWELRILREGNLGTFWLTNPAYAQSTREPVRPKAGHGISGNGQAVPPADSHHPKFTTPDSLEEFSHRLAAVFHDADRPQFDTWLPCYRRLFESAREWKPRRICEIGVRAGYSAFTLLAANPAANLVGIEADRDESVVDTHGGRKGSWNHARQILEPFDVQLRLIDSHAIGRLPEVDLVYVDGDHSFLGCLADLRLAAASTNRILVDDFDLIPSVRQACDTFTTEHPEFQRTYIDNHVTGFLLFEREPTHD